MKKVSYEEWKAEGQRRFGKDGRRWKFICPICGTVQSAKTFEEYTELTPVEIVRQIGINCIGRSAIGGAAITDLDKPPSSDPNAIGCMYHGNGLIRANPVTVELDDGHTMTAFDFAPEKDALAS